MSVNLLERLKALDSNVKATFKATTPSGVASGKGVFYDETPVTGKFAEVVALSSVPGMREFKSERVAGIIDGTTSVISPRTWEATLAVKRTDIEDDNLGFIVAAVKQMKIKSGKHYDALAVAALNAGFTTKLSDGVEFIAESRGNLATGVLDSANMNAAIDQLEAQKDADGEVIGYKADTLLVGSANRAAAKALVEAQNLASGASNTDYQALKLVVDPRIAGTAWFVLDTSEGGYPVTIAVRIATGAPVAKNDLNSDKAFDRDIFEWGLRGRYDAAYADPKLIVGSLGTA